MSETPEKMSCIPSFEFRRNEYGLLTHIDHIFNPDGTVNWRKMVPNDCLVANKSRTEETDIAKIPDEDLLILLAGFKEVAQIRGYREVRHSPIVATPEYVAVKTEIVWTPNYETGNQAVSFCSLANASMDNTEGFGKLFLMEIAENRGFCRAVRNFLKIHVLGKDEASKDIVNDGPKQKSAVLSSADTLLRMIDEAGLDFDKLKSGMSTKEGWEEKASAWESFETIDPKDHFEIMGYIKDYIKKLKSKKK